MPILDNDNFFQATNMTETTSRPDLIYNEFKSRVLASLGAFVQFSVDSPPLSPDDGDAYLISGSPTIGSDWEGAANRIAVWSNGWKYLNPRNGMRLMVLEGVGEGRVVDYWLSNWSSTGGQQTLSVVEASPGQYEADWNLAFGQLAHLTLNQATVTLNHPSGVRYGRPHYLRVKQDPTGGRNLALKVGDYVVSDDTPHGPSGLSIATGAGEETLIEFINLGPTYAGPLARVIHSDIVSV